jgi:hypothetical protein
VKFLAPVESVHGRRPASLWERSASHVIDVLAQASLQIVLAFVFAWGELSGLVRDSVAAGGDPEVLMANLVEALSGRLLLSLIAAWLVGGVAETLLTRLFGGSLGKILLGLEVVDATSGRRLPTRRVVLRWLGLGWAAPAGLVFPAAQFVPFFGYALAWFDPRRAALHDRLVAALVVRRVPGGA